MEDIIKCPHCLSNNLRKNGTTKGKQSYQCRDCKKYFVEGAIYHKNVPTSTNGHAKANGKRIGIPIEEFRKKHDVDFIVLETMKKLDPKAIYEKADIIQLTGLRQGYPRLSATIESMSEYMGRAGGKTYWSHPNTIRQMKEETVMI